MITINFIKKLYTTIFFFFNGKNTQLKAICTLYHIYFYHQIQFLYDEEEIKFFENQLNDLDSTILNDIKLYSCEFSKCGKICEIAISSSITSIPEYCFDECQSLIKITLHDLVTSIGEGAFSHCSSLKEINLPHFFDRNKIIHF